MSLTLESIAHSVIKGNPVEVKKLVLNALDEGLAPPAILNDGLINAITMVGNEYAQGHLFIPEMLLAARAMKSGIEVLSPYLTQSSTQAKGVAVIGSVEGDVHDIGKNLVALMLRGVGFEVVDLGVNVKTETFIEAVKEHHAQILCLSSLLTTTMLKMKSVIDSLEETGLRQQLRIMVGGAPVTQAYANEIGADAYAEDAGSASSRALELLRKGDRSPSFHKKPAAPLIETGQSSFIDHVNDLSSFPPDVPMSHKLRISHAFQHIEGPVPWVDFVDDVVIAKVLGKAPLDWMPTSESETALGLSWAEMAAFAQKLGLGALGLNHRDYFGSQREGQFAVVSRKPLIKSRSDLANIQEPPIEEAKIISQVDEADNELRDSGIALFAEVTFCLDQAIAAVGFEQFCMLLRDEPKFILELLERYAQHNERMIEIDSSLSNIDFILISDDLAYKSGPFFPPELFRELIFPIFQRLAKRIKKPWIFHSDGKLDLILEDILALGSSAIHPIEPTCNDIYSLKEKIGDRICLHGNLNLDLISRGSKEEVRKEAQQLLSQLHRGGGYIFSSGNGLAYYSRVKNVIEMARAVRQYNFENYHNYT
jgi:5-methyltetrahydrofolate--homocysteine methyltransferase